MIGKYCVAIKLKSGYIKNGMHIQTLYDYLLLSQQRFIFFEPAIKYKCA
jgi:hypothetical protein